MTAAFAASDSSGTALSLKRSKTFLSVSLNPPLRPWLEPGRFAFDDLGDLASRFAASSASMRWASAIFSASAAAASSASAFSAASFAALRRAAVFYQ